MWSFGVEEDWSFEASMVAQGCAVTSFDPSIDRRKAAAFGRALGVRYFPWGLSGEEEQETQYGVLGQAVDEAVLAAGQLAGETGQASGPPQQQQKAEENELQYQV